MTLDHNSECVISTTDYDRFEVWNTCPDVFASYTSQKYSDLDNNKCYYTAVNSVLPRGT